MSFDYFISYNRADRAKAVWIADVLREEGYDPFIQDWHIRAGHNFVIKMHDAIREAQCILLVLSEEAMASGFVDSEWSTAFADSPDGEERRLIPVRVDDVEPEGLLKPLVYIDLVDKDEAEAREALLEGVRRDPVVRERPAFERVSSKPSPTQERTAAYYHAVGEVLDGMGDGLGGCYRISFRRAICCSHVVELALGEAIDGAQVVGRSIYVRFPLAQDGVSIAARVLSHQAAGNVSVLELVQPEGQFIPPPMIAAASSARLSNHRVLIFGVTGGSLSEDGLEMRVAEPSNGRVDLKFSGKQGKLAPGFVGAPVWDRQERGVIGILTAGDDGTGQPSLIPVSSLKALLSADETPLMRTLPTQAAVAPAHVTRPGLFRFLLDRVAPGLHRFLTYRVRLCSIPPEADTIEDYLRRLRADIHADMQDQTYIPLSARQVDRQPDDDRPTTIRQALRLVAGRSQGGGDEATAQIAALSSKSKAVSNVVKLLLRSQDPLIVLGDPGTGKSMTLKKAIVVLADRELGRVYARVPLFLRLGAFHIPGEEAVDADSVWNFVTADAPGSIGSLLKDLSFKRRLLVMFDGMDEMSRERYNEHTRALSAFAERERGRTRTLFSCRITDFSPEFRHRRLVLMPFDRAQTRAFARQRISSFPIQVGDESFTLKQLVRRLVEDETGMLGGNPFALHLMFGFIQSRSAWPASRVELVEFYIEAVFARKVEEGEAGLKKERLRHYLDTWSRIAYLITQRNRGTGIPVGVLLAKLKLGRDGEVTQDAIDAGVTCGFLIEEPDTMQVRFAHHRLHEYFTALRLFHRPVRIDWLRRIDSPRWQETLLNLVLMGGGENAMRALGDAIRQELEPREDDDDRPYERTPERHLADRVELRSRIYSRAPPETEAQREEHLDALYRLADRGNPSTQLKMLRAATATPFADPRRAARAALGGKVRWVRAQALIVTSKSSRSARTGQTLSDDLALGHAQGLTHQDIGTYARVAAKLKRPGLIWKVAATALVAVAEFALVLLGAYLAAKGCADMGRHLEQKTTRNLARAQLKVDVLRAIDREPSEKLLNHLENKKRGDRIGRAVNGVYGHGFVIPAVLLAVLIAFVAARASDTSVIMLWGAGVAAGLLTAPLVVILLWELGGFYWIFMIMGLVVFCLALLGILAWLVLAVRMGASALQWRLVGYRGEAGLWRTIVDSSGVADRAKDLENLAILIGWVALVLGVAAYKWICTKTIGYTGWLGLPELPVPVLVAGTIWIAVHVSTLLALVALGCLVSRRGEEARTVGGAALAIVLIFPGVALGLWALFDWVFPLIGKLFSGSFWDIVGRGLLAIVVIGAVLWGVVKAAPYVAGAFRRFASAFRFRRAKLSIDQIEIAVPAMRSKPRDQAWMIARLEESTVSPQRRLDVLDRLEGFVSEEPALSAYWSCRYKLEEIVRQAGDAPDE